MMDSVTGQGDEAIRDKQADRILGRIQHRRRQVIALLIFLAGIALLFTQSWWESETDLHEAIEAVGLWLIAVCIGGRAWCTLYIGGRKKVELMTYGPYSLSRNPLYVFSLIGAIGVGAQLGNLTLPLVFGLLCYLVFSIVIFCEEQFLAATFGAAYQAYKVKVPRFFPRLHGYRDPGQLRFSPRHFMLTVRDGLVFLAAFPLFEGVEMLQEVGILPVLLKLP